MGMVQAMVIKTKCLSKGKSLNNMSYTLAFNDFCNLLASTSPRAYKTFHRHFGGRGIRSMRYVSPPKRLSGRIAETHCRQLRANLPRFEAGISQNNVQMAASVLEKIKYEGLVALSWDDTALEPSLSVWGEGKDTWVILGGTDRPIRVTSADDVDNVFDDPKLKKAEKVRSFVIGVQYVTQLNNDSFGSTFLQCLLQRYHQSWLPPLPVAPKTLLSRSLTCTRL